MRNVKFGTCPLAGLLAWTAATAAEARRDGRLPHHNSMRQDGLSPGLERLKFSEIIVLADVHATVSQNVVRRDRMKINIGEHQI